MSKNYFKDLDRQKAKDQDPLFRLWSNNRTIRLGSDPYLGLSDEETESLAEQEVTRIFRIPESSVAELLYETWGLKNLDSDELVALTDEEVNDAISFVTELQLSEDQRRQDTLRLLADSVRRGYDEDGFTG